MGLKRTEDRNGMMHLRIAVLSAICCTTAGCFVAAMTVKKNEFLARRSEAKDAIDAIYKYRHETGLWPQALDDLTGEGTLIPSDWHYVWPGYDPKHPPALRIAGPLHMSMTYSCVEPGSSVRGGWKARMEGDPVAVDDDYEIPAFSKINVAGQRQRAIEELKRRIQREPNEPRHRERLQAAINLAEGIGLAPSKEDGAHK